MTPESLDYQVSFSTAGSPATTAKAGVTLEALVGETITFTPKVTVGTFAGTVTAAPAGSSAAWSGSTFTPDVAGKYYLTLANGTNPPISVMAVAFPASALTTPMIAQKNWARRQTPSVAIAAEPRDLASCRRVLRWIANGHGGYFADATFAALTTPAPLPVGLNPASFPS